MIDRAALEALFADESDDSLVGIEIYGTGQPAFLIDAILALNETEHGYPFEVVIPCNSEAEAWEERADLHVAAEARSIIRRLR